MNENNPLVTELMARAGGASVSEAAGAARAGSRGLGDLPARTTLTVAAAVIAVVAIAATSWGLARHDDGKKSASPDAPESSEMTFGPNQPDTTSTTYPTLPTFPEASTPELTDLFTTPTYPTASAPLPTYRTSAYSYPSSTYSYSYTPPTTSSHTSSSPTTDPSWSPPPSPTKVTPGAPTATEITRCGTYGRLTVPKTESVRYVLTVGNGKQGRWVIRAFAKKGYEITSGATTRWSGNLGRYFKCPTIKRVTVTAGATETDPWKVTVVTTVSERDKRTLSVVYEFDSDVTVTDEGGAGWTCTGPLDDDAQGPFTCTFSPAGQQPGPVTLYVATQDAPTGTVTLFANRTRVDFDSFGG
jgi:hypothetical protein